MVHPNSKKAPNIVLVEGQRDGELSKCIHLYVLRMTVAIAMK